MAFSRYRLVCFATLPDGYSFEERVAAAATAGFNEMSFWLLSLDEARVELGSLEAVRDVLDRHGVKATVLEFLTAWSRATPAGHLEELEVMLAAADVFAPEVVMVGCLEAEMADRAAAVARLGEMCRTARARGYLFNFALEFLPWSAIPDLPAALSLVAEVAEPNLGLVLDTWHFARTGADYPSLAALPGEKLHFIQVSDLRADAGPDTIRETLAHRVAPGEGVLDWPRLLAILTDRGVTCPVGTEQFSDAVKAMPLQEACDYLYATVSGLSA